MSLKILPLVTCFSDLLSCFIRQAMCLLLIMIMLYFFAFQRVIQLINTQIFFDLCLLQPDSYTPTYERYRFIQQQANKQQVQLPPNQASDKRNESNRGHTRSVACHGDVIMSLMAWIRCCLVSCVS